MQTISFLEMSKKKIINLSCAHLAQRVVKVKRLKAPPFRYIIPLEIFPDIPYLLPCDFLTASEPAMGVEILLN